MSLKVTNGFIKRPQKVVIYGPEGIGKTTLAAQFPSPLFIDTEGGTAHMNVCRLEWGSDWKSLLETVKEVAKSKQLCETLIIDTADWAEQLCIKYVCETHLINREPASGIEDYGYGKGYTYVGEEFSKLLSALNDVIANGIHVVITAHAKMRKFEQPDELGAYDRWEMKLSKQAAPLLKEWADMLLFCNYKTNVVTVDKSNTKKAHGGKRVIYTSHHPCWDAKNRHGIPEKLDMDYEQIRNVIEGAPAEKPVKKAEQKPAPQSVQETAEPEMTPLERLRLMMQSAALEDEDIQAACSMAKLQPKNKPLDKYEDKFIQEQLLDKWDKFHKFVLKNVKKVPKEWVDQEDK